eukprot:m.25813 g.25813  ORF g.25813 m.25813 type:complete len:103 (+) comp11629_c0_seq3:548-856(+)
MAMSYGVCGGWNTNMSGMLSGDNHMVSGSELDRSELRYKDEWFLQALRSHVSADANLSISAGYLSIPSYTQAFAQSRYQQCCKYRSRDMCHGSCSPCRLGFR